MRILFTTDYPDSISSLINIRNFKKLSDIPGVQIDFGGNAYENYDVVLFMGYDVRMPEVKEINPRAKVGVIDPRPGTTPHLRNVDFIVANGIEMRDCHAARFQNIFIYPIYQDIPPCCRIHKKGAITLGYHGNKANLHLMHPGITSAINALAKEYDVKLKLFYNVKNLGELDFQLCDPAVDVEVIPFEEDKLAEFAASVDVGLVPNLTPIANRSLWARLLSTPFRFYNEKPSEVLTRHKATANPGRIFLFAQSGVPVVAGALPSTATVIRDGEGGFVTTTPAGWYWALKQLAASPELRQKMGTTLQKNVEENYSIEELNGRFLRFLKELPQTQANTPHIHSGSPCATQLFLRGCSKLLATYSGIFLRKIKSIIKNIKNSTDK